MSTAMLSKSLQLGDSDFLGSDQPLSFCLFRKGSIRSLVSACAPTNPKRASSTASSIPLPSYFSLQPYKYPRTALIAYEFFYLLLSRLYIYLTYRYNVCRSGYSRRYAPLLSISAPPGRCCQLNNRLSGISRSTILTACSLYFHFDCPYFLRYPLDSYLLYTSPLGSTLLRFRSRKELHLPDHLRTGCSAIQIEA